MAAPRPAAEVTNPQADDVAAKKNDALWYAFSGIGRAYLVQRGTAASTDADVSGVHGYSTIEQAVSNPNSNNAATQATISQWDTWASLPVGGGTFGVIETVNITWNKNHTEATSSTQQNPVTAAGSSLLNMNWSNWVMRIGEVVLGVVLIGVALNAMLNNPVVKSVGTAARVAR